MCFVASRHTNDTATQALNAWTCTRMGSYAIMSNGAMMHTHHTIMRGAQHLRVLGPDLLSLARKQEASHEYKPRHATMLTVNRHSIVGQLAAM